MGWAILSNPVVKWLLIVVTVLFGLKVYGEKRERDGRITERTRQQRRETEALQQLETETDDIPRRAAEARARTSVPGHAGELPDDIAGVLFGDRAGKRHDT